MQSLLLAVCERCRVPCRRRYRIVGAALCRVLLGGKTLRLDSVEILRKRNWATEYGRPGHLEMRTGDAGCKVVACLRASRVTHEYVFPRAPNAHQHTGSRAWGRIKRPGVSRKCTMLIPHRRECRTGVKPTPQRNGAP